MLNSLIVVGLSPGAKHLCNFGKILLFCYPNILFACILPPNISTIVRNSKFFLAHQDEILAMEPINCINETSEPKVQSSNFESDRFPRIKNRLIFTMNAYSATFAPKHKFAPVLSQKINNAKMAAIYFRRHLTSLQPLSLTHLNKKNFDFQGSPFGFSSPSKCEYQ